MVGMECDSALQCLVGVDNFRRDEAGFGRHDGPRRGRRYQRSYE